MAERRRGRGQKIDLGKIVNSAIEEGIDAIIQRHPRFTDQEDLLLSYLDKKKINKYLDDYAQNSGGNIDLKDLTEKFGGYVASGEFFNEKGKGLILRKSLEEDSRRLFAGGMAREILKGEKYLDETMASFRDLYKLFQTGDYSKRMPELAKAVADVYDMGFADAAINILYENGLMNNNKYKVFKRAINERVKQGVEYTQKSLEEYVIPQKIAASILGIVGLSSILANSTITGNVIGVGNPNIFGFLLGMLLLVSGIWLWFKKK